MYNNFINFLKFTKLNHCIKNLLIIFPVLASGIPINEISIIIFYKGFLALVLLTSACYILNDLNDRSIDKLNKLKRNKFIYTKNNSLIFFLGISLLFIFLTVVNEEIKFKFLIFYFINFLIYNYFAKKIKFLDILFLVNFYNLRVFFGADIFDIEPTKGFILLNFTFFIILSISKRQIQINVNKLKYKNNLIPYSIKDIPTLNLVAQFCFYLINLILVLYYFQYFNFLKIEKSFIFLFLGTNLDLYKIFASHLIFLIYYLYINKLLLSRKIRMDIYDFIIKNKWSYIILILIVSIFYY